MTKEIKEDEGVKIHVGCGGVLYKEYHAANEMNLRCAYCKKVVGTETLRPEEDPVEQLLMEERKKNGE